MPRQVFNVDEARKGVTRPGWKSIEYDRFVLADRLTLIDESANFAQYPYQIRDNVRYLTHYPGPVEFELLKFFGEPRTRAEVGEFFTHELPGLLPQGTIVDEPLDAYMDRLIGLLLIKPTHERFDEIQKSRGKEDRTIVFTAPPIQGHDKRVRSAPISVGINLTERCNLACLHCSVSSNPHVSTKDDLTKEELSGVFDQLEDMGVETVRLTGGEPMVRPDFWEIFDDAASRRFSLVLYTNGTRLNEDNVLRLAEVRKKKGSRFSVHISLDGGTAAAHDFLRNRQGNFERVLQAMALLQRHKVHFFGESVLHRASATPDQIDKMAEIIHRHGASFLSIHPGEQIGTGEAEESIYFTREDLAKLNTDIKPIVEKWAKRGVTINFHSYTFPLDEPKAEPVELIVHDTAPIGAKASDPAWKRAFQTDLTKSRQSGFDVCTAGISQLALGADGRVYGCPRYVGARPYAIGSVRERSVLDIWTSSGWDFVREDYRPKLRLCNDCNYFSNCFYGKTCRANPGYLFNDAYGVSPECIREYRALGLPHEKVVAYLKDRKAENPEDFRIQALCDRLLALVEGRERAADPAKVGLGVN